MKDTKGEAILDEAGATRRRFLKEATLATAGFVIACTPGAEDPRLDGGSGGLHDGGSGRDSGDGQELDGGASPRADAGQPDEDAGLEQDAGDVEEEGEDAGPSEPVVAPETWPESLFFALGVGSGDVEQDSAILWTRYTGLLPLQLRVYEMDGEVYLREHAPIDVAPADAGYLHVEVTGLTRGARHRFAFLEMDAGEPVSRSLVGRFRAALPDGALEPLTLGAVSCTKRNYDLAALAASADLELDAFFLLGDTAYCDGATTLGEYRSKWRKSIEKPEHVQLRASTSLLATWDDHEVENNWHPDTVDAAKLAAARAAFFDHLPLRRLPGAPDRIWRSRRFGDTAEVFVLDCRGERSGGQFSLDRKYISVEQMQWLKTSLAGSPARFKIILNTVPITNFPGVFDFKKGDRWEGYPAQRDEILQFIDDEAIGGVVFLAGDFHLACIAQISTSGAGSGHREILVGPGAQDPNELAPTLTPPQFSWATGQNNFATLHLDPMTGEVTVTHVGAGGVTLHEETFVQP